MEFSIKYRDEDSLSYLTSNWKPRRDFSKMLTIKELSFFFFFSSGAMHRTADTTARKLEFEESLKKEKLVMNGTRMMTDKSGKRGLL